MFCVVVANSWARPRWENQRSPPKATTAITFPFGAALRMTLMSVRRKARDPYLDEPSRHPSVTSFRVIGHGGLGKPCGLPVEADMYAGGPVAVDQQLAFGQRRLFGRCCSSVQMLGATRAGSGTSGDSGGHRVHMPMPLSPWQLSDFAICCQGQEAGEAGMSNVECRTLNDECRMGREARKSAVGTPPSPRLRRTSRQEAVSGNQHPASSAAGGEAGLAACGSRFARAAGFW